MSVGSPELRAQARQWHGSVPNSWAVRRFKQVAIVREGQVDPEDDNYRTLPLFAPNHIESGTGRLLDVETATEQGAESGKYLVDAGDVLYSKIRPALRKVALAPCAGLCSADMYPIKPGPDIDARFLFYSMLGEGFFRYSVLESARVAMPKINREALGECLLLVPSRSEQRAIADFLDHKTAAIDALIEKKERLLDLLAEKRQAIIDAAATGGETTGAMCDWFPSTPDAWTVKRLKHIAVIHSGIAKGRDANGTPTTALPYLRVANVQNGYLDLTELTELEVTADEAVRFALRPGDVLMNEGGDFDKLGRGFVWEGQVSPCLHQNHVFAVRPRNGVNPYWVNLATQASYLRHFFTLRSKQSTNLASISSTNLGEAPVLMPPARDVEPILRRLDANLTRLDALRAAEVKQLEHLSEYRQALITAAVTGQLDGAVQEAA